MSTEEHSNSDPAWDDLEPEQKQRLLDLANDDGGVTRRDVLAGGGALGFGALLGGGASQAMTEPAAASHGDGTVGAAGSPIDTAYVTSIDGDGDTVDIGPSLSTDGLNGAEQVTASRTIQGVHDALPSGGGVIEVTPDYDPTDETLPISVTKPCWIVGPGQTHDDPVLDFSGNSSDPVFEVNVPTLSSDYENSVTIEGFRIRGGDYAVVIDSTQRGFFRDLTLLGQATAAVELRGSSQAPFSNTFEDVYVEASANGFVEATGAGGHNTRLRNCRVRGCTGDPINFNQGQGVWVEGGEYARNDGRLFFDNGFTGLRDVYIEDNDSANAFDVDFRPDAGFIAGCRFQGGDNNDRAINLNFTEDSHVALNAFINYASGFVQVNADATDCDIHASMNAALDDTPLLAANAGTRTRSDGVIGGGPLGGVDLSTTTGQYEGDRAQADGTSAAAAYAMATWDSASTVWEYTDPSGTV